MLNAESIKTILTRIPLAGKGERLLRLAVTLLLTLLVAWMAAELTWQLSAGLTGREDARSPATLPRQPRSGAAASVQPLPRNLQEIDLFGKALATASPLQTRPAEAVPVTTLNLILKGVIAARPMSRALAIIADKSGRDEQLFGLGEQIPGNAMITEIHADRVIISRGGTVETLLLEGSESPQASRDANGRERRAAGAGASITAQGDGTNWRIREDYWNERLADLPGLAREVGVEIYKENNQQVGYKLISAQGSRLLSNLGLQPGDILLTVNGRPMTSVQDGLAAYQQIRNGRRVQIEISRDGRRETKVYNIDN